VGGEKKIGRGDLGKEKRTALTCFKENRDTVRDYLRSLVL